MTEKQVGVGMYNLNEKDEIWGFNRRWTIFSNIIWVNISERLVSLLGPVAKRQIYEVGYSSGKLAGERIRPHFGGGIDQYKQHVGLTSAMGWGNPEIKSYNEDTGEIIVEYPNLWEAEGFSELHPNEKSESPTCIMAGGMAAGAAEGAMDVPYEVEEVLCVSKGDPVCKFILTPAGKEKKVMK